MKDCKEELFDRVSRMEQYFDKIRNAVMYDPEVLSKDADLAEMLQELICYYENGQWLSDYECDERGELSADLKRGVLSQDALYDFLSGLGE